MVFPVTFGGSVSLIPRSAFLTLCPKHWGQAFIVFRDDSKSDHFGDAVLGWEILRTAKKEGKVDEGEFKALSEQIDSCSFGKDSVSELPHGHHLALIVVAVESQDNKGFDEFRPGKPSVN